MTARIEHLVRDFERGAISRRELIAGFLALCAAQTGGAGTALASGPQAEPLAPIPLTGLDHIALRVSDLARATAFYRNHLG